MGRSQDFASDSFCQVFSAIRMNGLHRKNHRINNYIPSSTKPFSVSLPFSRFDPFSQENNKATSGVLQAGMLNLADAVSSLGPRDSPHSQPGLLGTATVWRLPASSVPRPPLCHKRPAKGSVRGSRHRGQGRHLNPPPPAFCSPKHCRCHFQPCS